MPVMTRKLRGKFRLIESESGKLARNEKGTPIDGGGSQDKAKVDRQARAVNANLSEKKK